MANLMQSAQEYVPPTTKVISDLKKVSVSLELFNKTVELETPNEKGETSFSYDYILIEDQEYRVPKPVLSQLKDQLEANEKLMFFKVTKKGEGRKTSYTVIPLTE